MDFGGELGKTRTADGDVVYWNTRYVAFASQPGHFATGRLVQKGGTMLAFSKSLIKHTHRLIKVNVERFTETTKQFRCVWRSNKSAVVPTSY